MYHKEAEMSPTKKNTHDIPDNVIDSFANCLLPSIQAYFSSEQGQREFAEWLAEKEKADPTEAN